jgi:aspartyl-tRNA(Asn)/glutamyl-tRNA(Gln) amidotransferase subunit C
MEVNDSLIEKLANLSRLEFEEEEKAEIKKGLQEMIGFIDKLNELNTTGVEPLLHMSENVNVFRKDEIKGEINRQEVFKNAPLHDGSFFKVPKVIKK